MICAYHDVIPWTNPLVVVCEPVCGSDKQGNCVVFLGRAHLYDTFS